MKSVSNTLFQALVRPNLEYAEAVWSPYLKKDIESLENVQRRATKQVPSLANLDYTERLKKLKMPTLKYRRLRGDMIETYKIMTGIYDPDVTPGLFELASTDRTRGNRYKIIKKNCRLNIRKYSFTHRVVDIWNNLPDRVVTAKTVKSFENRLDKLWSNQDIKYDHSANYKTTSGSQNDNVEDINEEEADIVAAMPASTVVPEVS